MTKSVLGEWNLDSQEVVLKWLAERGITPEWDERSGDVGFFPHLNRTAVNHFKDVLQLTTRSETLSVKKQLTSRPDWNILNNEQSRT